MKKLEFNVQEPYLSYIKSGEKTVEGRLNKGKFESLEVGDVVVLDDKSNFQFQVVAKRNYQTFSDMISQEGVKNVTPDKDSVGSGANVYYRFFTPEQEKQFGVVAIEIRRK